MICSLENMRSKEVIDVQTGERLGYIDDVKMNIETAGIIALVIYGRDRFFGLLGKEEDIIIPCSEIEVVGHDVLLVKRSQDREFMFETKNKKNKFKTLFK